MSEYERFQQLLIDNLLPQVNDLYGAHGHQLSAIMLDEALGTPTEVTPLRQPRRDEQFIQGLLGHFTEISASFDNLLDTPVYLRRFPFRNTRVTPASYVRYHFENYIQEIYLLQNRLKMLRTWLVRAYRKSEQYDVIREHAELAYAVAEKTLEKLVRIRGAHVHQSRIDEFGLRRLGVASMFATADPKYLTLLNLALREVRREKIAWTNNTNERLRQLLDVYFGQLRPVLFSKTGMLTVPAESRPG